MEGLGESTGSSVAGHQAEGWWLERMLGRRWLFQSLTSSYASVLLPPLSFLSSSVSDPVSLLGLGILWLFWS